MNQSQHLWTGSWVMNQFSSDLSLYPSWASFRDPNPIPCRKLDPSIPTDDLDRLSSLESTLLYRIFDLLEDADLTDFFSTCSKLTFYHSDQTYWRHRLWVKFNLRIQGRPRFWYRHLIACLLDPTSQVEFKELSSMMCRNHLGMDPRFIPVTSRPQVFLPGDKRILPTIKRALEENQLDWVKYLVDRLPYGDPSRLNSLTRLGKILARYDCFDIIREIWSRISSTTNQVSFLRGVRIGATFAKNPLPFLREIEKWDEGSCWRLNACSALENAAERGDRELLDFLCQKPLDDEQMISIVIGAARGFSERSLETQSSGGSPETSVDGSQTSKVIEGSPERSVNGGQTDNQAGEGPPKASLETQSSGGSPETSVDCQSAGNQAGEGSPERSIHLDLIEECLALDPSLKDAIVEGAAMGDNFNLYQKYLLRLDFGDLDILAETFSMKKDFQKPKFTSRDSSGRRYFARYTRAFFDQFLREWREESVEEYRSEFSEEYRSETIFNLLIQADDASSFRQLALKEPRPFRLLLSSAIEDESWEVLSEMIKLYLGQIPEFKGEFDHRTITCEVGELILFLLDSREKLFREGSFLAQFISPVNLLGDVLNRLSGHPQPFWLEGKPVRDRSEDKEEEKYYQRLRENLEKRNHRILRVLTPHLNPRARGELLRLASRLERQDEMSGLEEEVLEYLEG